MGMMRKGLRGDGEYRGSHYRWLMVFAGFLSMVFYYGIVINCQGQLIEPIAEEQGYNRVIMSSIFALINGGMVVSSPLLAHISNRFGPEKTLVACSLVISMAMIWFSFSRSLLFYYLSALLIGMAFVGVTTLLLPILVNMWFDANNRGFALSLAFMGSGIGGLLLNPAFATLVKGLNWRWAYSLSGGFFLLLFTPFLFIVIYYLPRKRGYLPPLTDLEDFTLGGSSNLDRGTLDYRLVIGSVCVAAFLIGGTGSSVLLHGTSHLVTLGQTPGEASMVIGLFLGVLAFSKLLVGRSCDKLGCKKTLIIFLGLASAGTFSLFLCSFTVLGCILFIGFFGLGGAAMTVCPPLVVREIFSNQRYSQELGKVMASIGLGNMGIPLIGGMIYDYTGSYNGFWIFDSVLLLVAITLFMFGFHKANRSGSPK
jgi:MFS family permease